MINKIIQHLICYYQVYRFDVKPRQNADYSYFNYYYDQLVIKPMSLQKIKSAKNVTYTDRYSKNTIINSLIKNKLQTQMVQIKESFANIIKKQSETDPQRGSIKEPIRRNKSYSINPKLIQQAVQYDPIQRLNKTTQQFVASRQVDSFLIPVEELRQINKAREEHSGLNTKLSRADVLSYETQNMQQLAKKAQQITVRNYNEQVWLPNKPEVRFLIQNKKQQIQQEMSSLSGKKYSEGVQEQLEKLTNRISGGIFSGSQIQKKVPVLPLDSLSSQSHLQPTSYIPQKYHKNDYKLLQNWLQSTIQQIGKEKLNPQDKLNLVYSSYVCVWKQLIRLTYVQSDEKGLLLQKVFYSMLRLFWGLISEQQSLSRAYLKESEIQHNQIKKLMEHRMQQLNRRHLINVKQSEQLRESNHKLSKMLISFEKVNRELVDELEKMTNEKKKIEREFFSIGNSYFKTLELLYDKRLIQMDYTRQQEQLPSKKNTSEYKSYLLIDKNSKPVLLGRFKTQLDVPHAKPKYTSDTLQQTVSEEMKKYNDRYGHTVKELENVLNRFWDKKQDDLEMKGILHDLISDTKIKDSCVGTTKNQLQDFMCQFPENNQNYIQKLLKDLSDQLNSKFTIQRQQFEAQLLKKQAIFQRWKASAEQLLEKNKGLHENNLKLNENLKKTKQGSNDLVKQIDSLAKNITQLKDEIQNLNNQLERVKTSEQLAKSNEKTAVNQKQILRNEVEREKQNNRMLVRGNLEMKEKAEKFDIRYNTLLKSVKNVSPWLEKFMVEADKSVEEIDISLLKSVSNKIEQHLSEYVTKDSTLFMTRL